MNRYAIICICIGILVVSKVPRVDASTLNESPSRFFQAENGDFHGYTVTGRYFSQTSVFNTQDIRLHNFAIGNVSYYISDRGIIWAASDTEALSIYLSLV